jgi:hypothetical protein
MKPAILPLIFIVSLTAVLGGCVMNRVSTEAQTIVLRDGGSAAMRIEIEPGTEWSSHMRAGPFIFNVLPQFAIWTEDTAGNLVETLYVTGADFASMRHAGKNERQGEFFAQSLPVWSSRIAATGSPLPSKANPYPDLSGFDTALEQVASIAVTRF